MTNGRVKRARALFMPIAVLEHHAAVDPKLSIYEICDQLEKVWIQVTEEVRTGSFGLGATAIQHLNKLVSESLDADAIEFKRPETWSDFFSECGAIEDDVDSVCSWLFSELYWNRLTAARLATSWMYINAVRLRTGHSQIAFSLDKLGPLLESLSGSGPPIYDGQSFSLGDYTNDML
ncbi:MULTISPECIES: hypothetical protein [Pseudomonas]|uniref:Uncharacterized protein n=1 Tax=Pseudomonas fulva TaxID=47880 RepID=A0A0D0IZZ3_9PSED|nr:MULTISPECIES: hypothetical protein [Pseudomonas]KIP88633.1 hypothetical protein RU08_24700 [Pseudomonas fulva]